MNDPLLEQLAAVTSFTDPECIQCFRRGAPVTGTIPAAASAKTHEYAPAEPVEKLRQQCRVRNERLMASLREDKHASFLMEQTKADAAAERMTMPIPVTQLDTDSLLLARRFSREQGLRANGEQKLRAVDDESANGVNETSRPVAKPVADGIDKMVQTTLSMRQGGVKKLAF